MNILSILRRYGRLWRYLARRSMMTQLTYRGDFLMGLARNAATVALALVFYQVLFLRTSSIAGWSEPALLVLYGTFRLVRGILYFFVEDTITTIPEAVRRGELDFLLLKPVSARFLLTCAQVNLGAAFNTAIGVGLVVYGLHASAAPVTVGMLAGYLGLVICAVVIFYNILFMVMTIAFWTIQVDGLQYMFEELLNMAGLPNAAYRGALGVVFSYVLPVGIAASVPAGVLVGHAAPALYFYGPLFGLAGCLASSRLWRRAVASYTSAGG
ncbi:MAG TPA: ABC-2 family transporter protein [Chloroflexota bacterium]|nr:ABC-2 family transporter protein [Chloroflexota bacterium]